MAQLPCHFANIHDGALGPSLSRCATAGSVTALGGATTVRRLIAAFERQVEWLNTEIARLKSTAVHRSHRGIAGIYNCRKRRRTAEATAVWFRRRKAILIPIVIVISARRAGHRWRSTVRMLGLRRFSPNALPRLRAAGRVRVGAVALAEDRVDQVRRERHHLRQRPRVADDDNGHDALVLVERQELSQAPEHEQREARQQQLRRHAGADAQRAAVVLEAQVLGRLDKLRHPHGRARAIARALGHGGPVEVVERLVHVVAQHHAVGRGVGAVVAVGELDVVGHLLAQEPRRQRHGHQVRALGPVALRRHHAPVVAVARGVGQLALDARADKRLAAGVGPRLGQLAVRELPVVEAGANGIAPVALADTRAAGAAESVVVVLLAPEQRVVRLVDRPAVFRFGEEARPVARHDAACRERRTKVETRASAVEAVKL